MAMITDDATPATRVSALRNGLGPTELRVAEAIQAEPERAVESTAQELADSLGVARSSVIRTCQKLGYRGWPQLRVALARQLALSIPSNDGPVGSDLQRLRSEVERFAALLPESLGLLQESGFDRAVSRITSAARVLCVANGLSAPLAQDFAMRLTAGGRPAEMVHDAMAQQITASQLSGDDVLVAVSGSGSNELTLRTVDAARRAGVWVVAVTSFATSPLVDLADDALTIASALDSFRDELEHASRISHAVFLHALVGIIVSRRGPGGKAARSDVLRVVAANLSDEQSFVPTQDEGESR